MYPHWQCLIAQNYEQLGLQTEPQREKTYHLTCAPKDDSNQPAHPRSLIRVFVVHAITKTYLYNFDPLKPHFYIVKLGFTGVYIIFLIAAQNIDCGYSLEPPHRGGSNEYPQSMGEAVLTSTHNLCFEQKYEKYKKNLSEHFHFLVVKFSIYLNRRVFVMAKKRCIFYYPKIYPVNLLIGLCH